MKEGNWKIGTMEMSVLGTGEERRDDRQENGERDGIGLLKEKMKREEEGGRKWCEEGNG